VHQNYDLLSEHRLRIVAETHLRVRHQLLGVRGARAGDLLEVHSHPQALGQCRDFLRRHVPGARPVPAYDTAGAARDVARAGDRTRAAIASRRAAEEYGLDILANDIESNHQNYTRFLALARPEQAGKESIATDHSGAALKTSILYAQKENVPGGLFKSLAVFALRDIDLFKIESRPLVGSPGHYVFYLDLAGAEWDDHVQHALAHLEEIAAYVTVLGTYAEGRRAGQD
jgi:prephenate dehydratase